MILAIDLRGMIYPAFFAAPAGTQFTPALGRRILEYARATDADHWIAAYEQRSSWRRDRFEAYKADRKTPPDALTRQIPEVMAWCEKQGLPVFEWPNMEADDVLASVVEKATHLSEPVTLVSDDKDMLQLCRTGVHVLRPQKAVERVADQFTVFREWGVPPRRIPDLFGLMGDSADNVPGVPGIGRVTAQSLIASFGSLERLYEVPEMWGVIAGQSVRGKLEEYREQAFLSRELVRLRTDIPVTTWSTIRKEALTA